MITEITSSQQINLSKPHAKYRTIIFDIGDVLIQWDPIAFVRSVIKNEEEQQHMLALFGHAMFQQWGADYDRGIVTPEDLIVQLPSDQDKQNMRRLGEQLPHHLFPIAKGAEWFNRAQAKGYRIYLLSNYPKELYESLVATYDFFKRVDGAVISYQIKKLKPEPDIYQALLSTYGLDPRECLFIDDKEENIQAGQALEIDGIVCRDHEQVDGQLRDADIF